MSEATGPSPLRPSPRGVVRVKGLIYAAALLVFVICLYTFLLGNEVFDGDFKNDGFAWYFLAKGIFCGLSLYLSVRLLEVLEAVREKL